MVERDEGNFGKKIVMGDSGEIDFVSDADKQKVGYNSLVYQGPMGKIQLPTRIGSGVPSI